MSIAVKKNRPFSEKHVLVELSIGQEQSVWFNYSAFTYYVDFDAIYALIDPAFLIGVSAQSVSEIGGISSDAAPLLSVGSIATCEATELSYYWDYPSKALYVHLQNGDPPSFHTLIIGVVYGVANHGGVWGTTYYAPRLISAPAISKSKDPLFFGKISIDGWSITIDNTPDPGADTGPFDRMLEDLDVFGNRIRTLAGFDDDEYSDFMLSVNGFIENVSTGEEELVIAAKDLKATLKAKVPDSFFDVVTYPNIEPGNIGKEIPLGYGVIKNAPVTCTNEAESPAPATFSFKICDMAHHAAISAITQVYVDGVAKATASTDLVNGTFTLATANYDPGQDVTVDYSGYEDALGNLIENALDVMKDLIVTWAGTAYLPETFDQSQWTATRAAVPNIGLFVEDETEIIDLIEQICQSAQVNLIVLDDGRYTARKSNDLSAWKYEVRQDEIVEDGLSPISADPTEVISSARVGHSKDWAADAWQYINDTSRQDEVLLRYKTKNPQTFDTLLTSAADAQTFATAILEAGSYVARIFSVTTKTQALGLELMDNIKCPIRRRSGKGMLGNVKAEIIGISKNFDSMEITLTCRIIEVYPDTIYVQGAWWGYRWWGYRWWEKTENQEIA
jgi:hypothetical protein